jgi:drug/metabolite transporter (DMT)-like permease
MQNLGKGPANSCYTLKNMTEVKTETQKIFTKMLIGGAVGFVFGFLVGMLINPPFSGMTETSSDVQGLTYFTWFGLGVLGGVLGILAWLVNYRKLRGEKHKAGTDNNA